MLYEAKVDKVVDISKIYPSANMQLEIKFDMINSNFNKPITVQAPTGAQKIEDIVLPLLKTQTSNLITPTLDLKTQKIDSDMNQVGFEAQSIFSANKSYALLCKNGFLNGSKITSYGLEFITDANDLIRQGAKNPICFAGAQDYCVSTQLSGGSYLCIDENSNLGTIIGKVKCISAQTVCK
jgi:hypothetical protein